DLEPVMRRHFPHPRQNVRQLLARNGAVHTKIIGREAADGGESRLAAEPEQLALSLALRNAHIGRAAAPRDGLDFADQKIDFALRAVKLDDQKRLDIER